MLQIISSAPSTLESYVATKFEFVAKETLLSALEDGIQQGSLTITTGEGKKYSITKGQAGVSADIHVVREIFWLRVFLRHDLGFSEAYMHGDFTTSNLKAIMDLWIINRHHLGSLSTLTNRMLASISAIGMWFWGQSMSNAKLNVVAAYDHGNELFKSFLSRDMMYSCALWTDDLGGPRGDIERPDVPSDLESAQLNKVHDVLRRVRARRGDRLLEFGTGWGTMAIEAAKLGCTVDTLTLSIEQKREAEARLQVLGLQDKVTVHLLDYRRLPPSFEHAFDCFVSVEMVEHVGLAYHSKFFKIIDWALKKDRGAACITATTTPDWRYTTLQTVDYARVYQWPNAFTPSPSAFVATAMQAVPGAFCLESVEDFAHHYPRTLREWGRRFQKNWNEKTIHTLINRHPDLAFGDNLEIFKRRWEFMFVYAEIGFARGYTSCHTWTFSRPETVIGRSD